MMFMHQSAQKKALLVIFSSLVIVGIFVGGFYAFNAYIYEQKQAVATSDFKNAEYRIAGETVALENGVSETEAAPGSSTKVTTRFFGNEVVTDINNDGRDDVVFLLTQETGGSGVFFYVAAALNTERGYVGSDALFLGDRIAPQTTEVGENGFIVVNYAERALDESFAVQPSHGKSIWLRFDPVSMQFGEVVQDFEGEANPDVMTLDMKSWTWIKTVYTNGEFTPKRTDAFTLTFANDGTFSATTDCNGLGGAYVVRDGGIVFSDMISTLMFCDGSEEAQFQSLLSDVGAYSFTSKGELIFTLPEGGRAVFK